MSDIIDLEEARLINAAKKGYRNWTTRFKEKFGLNTVLSQISIETLSYLAQGEGKGTFYLYDLIMNLLGLGSGFEFDELSPKNKMIVVDRYLFLLDRIRFECMKRLGWLERYPGEGIALVRFVTHFDQLAPILQAETPHLSQSYPGYDNYSAMNTLDREVFVRKLIPIALQEIEGYSTTL